MSALARADFIPWSLSEAVVSDLVRKGAHQFDSPLSPTGCGELLGEIRATRRFDDSLFLSQAEFAAAPARGVQGPKRGCNLLERLEPRLGFVERAPQVVEALWSLLGPDYRILDKRVVCALPAAALPAWVARRAQDGPIEDLCAYVRPGLRDISYSLGGEFRQDFGELSDYGADVVTLQVYLHPVAQGDAPLQLLEGSHRMGRAVCPPDLKRTGAAAWRYRNGDHGEMYLTERTLTGEAGSAAVWHACLLNGAAPAVEHPRLSLRYLIARGGAKTAGINAVNASLAGSGRITALRD